MVSSVIEDIKRQFQYGNVVTRLIIVNVAVFIAVNLAGLIFFLIMGKGGNDYFISSVLHPWFCASYEWKHILFKPWTIFTYMFLHYDFWHIIFNMLFLFWFGRILRDLGGNHRIFAIYVLGGLAGFVVYVISGILMDGSGIIGQYALGASAGVMAVVLAAAALAPEYSMHLLLIGPVRLKYIALVLVLMDLLFLSRGNTGGHFAHLGGAFMGWFFVYQLREKGNDLSIPFNNFIEKITGFFGNIKDRLSGKRRPKVVYKNPTGKRAKGNAKSDHLTIVPDQSEVDEILDKIKRNGYESLTPEELDTLACASKNAK